MALNDAGNSQSYNDTVQTQSQNNLTATTAPTVTDDADSGYSPGSHWVDLTGVLPVGMLFGLQVQLLHLQ